MTASFIDTSGALRLSGELTGATPAAGTPQAATTTLSSATLLALRRVPIELVPAPAAGELLVPLGATIVLHFATAAYAYQKYDGTPRAPNGPNLGWYGPLGEDFAQVFTSTVFGDPVRETKSVVFHHWGFADFDDFAYPTGGDFGVGGLPITMWLPDDVKLVSGGGSLSVRIFYAVSAVPALL